MAERRALETIAQRYAPDPMAVHLDAHWHYQGSKLTDEKKDLIGIAYLKHIIGANDQTIHAFLRKNRGEYAEMNNTIDANCFVDERHRKLRLYDYCSYRSFWTEVEKIAGHDHDKDIPWLIEQCGVLGPFKLLFDLNARDSSYVITQILKHAHAWR